MNYCFENCSDALESQIFFSQIFSSFFCGRCSMHEYCKRVRSFLVLGAKNNILDTIQSITAKQAEAHTKTQRHKEDWVWHASLFKKRK